MRGGELSDNTDKQTVLWGRILLNPPVIFNPSLPPHTIAHLSFVSHPFITHLSPTALSSQSDSCTSESVLSATVSPVSKSKVHAL